MPAIADTLTLVFPIKQQHPVSRLLPLVAFLCLSCHSWGKFWELPVEKIQRSWYTYLGGTGLDNITAVRQSPDGGYCVLGISQAAFTSLGGKSPIFAYTGATDFLVIKLTETGDVSWFNFFGTTVDDWAQDIAATSDGGCIAVGYNASATSTINGMNALFYVGGNASLGLVAKFGAAGALEWWTYIGGGGGQQQIRGVVQTSDSGYILAGIANSNFSNASCSSPKNAYSALFDFLAVKISSSGATQWCTFLGGAGNDYGISIRPEPGGGYFFAGNSDANIANIGGNTPLISYQGSTSDSTAMKLDAAGNLQWLTHIGTTGIDYTSQTAIAADGGLIIAGSFGATIATLGSFSYTGAYGGSDDAALVKLNSAGSLQWFRLFGSTGSDSVASVAVTADGSLIGAGKLGANAASLYGITPANNYAGGDDIFIFRTDSNGSLQWYTLYGGAGNDNGGSVEIATDGGFIVGATAAQNIPGITSGGPVNPYNANNDYLILKLKSNLGF